ncbi:MAG: MarR family winged helix-turn-helix transcriptional regulator [Gammaproteobacteria bacterium]
MDTHEQVLVALRRIIRAIDMRSRELMQHWGLTAPQIIILQAVAAQEAITGGELAKAVNLSQATVTTIINRLEARELLTRTRDSQDRRKVHIELTPMGIELLGKTPSLLQDHFINAFHDLDDWEQTLILASFQRVAGMMDADKLDAAPLLHTQALTEAGSSGSME